MSDATHKVSTELHIGTMMENGEMTADVACVGEAVKDICFRNSVAYFEI